jgi:hypothetical protein
MMIIAAEMWALDIANIWQIMTGWFDTYVLAAMLALLLLLVVVGQRTKETVTLEIAGA